MPRMCRTIALLIVAACCVTGCANTQSAIGSPPLVPISSEVAVGTWTLTDDRNITFNVVLREDGSATSTWSSGADGAKGEQGGWSIREGILTVRYTDGWVDTIRLGTYGYEKLSYGATERDTNLPSSFGQAVKLLDDSRRWVGVWRTTSSGAHSQGEEMFVCLSSDGAAVKSIDAINTGCWQQQATGAAIFWSDGWFTMLTRENDAVQGASWSPGMDHTLQPSGTTPWTEVAE